MVVSPFSEVKTFYVETFTGGEQAPNLRDSLVRRLSKSDRFHLVQSPKDADAVIVGSGQVWFRGFISINPRTPSTDRQAVYNGYLSSKLSALITSLASVMACYTQQTLVEYHHRRFGRLCSQKACRGRGSCPCVLRLSGLF